MEAEYDSLSVEDKNEKMVFCSSQCATAVGWFDYQERLDRHIYA